MGLADDVVAVKRTSPAGKQRLIYSQSKLHRVPTGFLSLFSRLPLIGNKTLAGIFMRERKIPASPELKGVDESIHSFVSRRFGVQVSGL